MTHSRSLVLSCRRDSSAPSRYRMLAAGQGGKGNTDADHPCQGVALPHPPCYLTPHFPPLRPCRKDLLVGQGTVYGRKQQTLQPCGQRPGSRTERFQPRMLALPEAAGSSRAPARDPQRAPALVPSQLWGWLCSGTLQLVTTKDIWSVF